MKTQSKRYYIYLEATKKEVTTGAMVRVDLTEGTTFADVAELNGFTFEVIESYTNGDRVTNYIRITGKEEALKGSVALTFSSYIEKCDYTDEVLRRANYADITATAGTADMAERIVLAVQERLEQELDLEYVGCPYEEQTKRGKFQYTDGLYFDFDLGAMKSIKDDIRYVFKQVKKELGLR